MIPLELLTHPAPRHTHAHTWRKPYARLKRSTITYSVISIDLLRIPIYDPFIPFFCRCSSRIWSWMLYKTFNIIKDVCENEGGRGRGLAQHTESAAVFSWCQYTCVDLISQTQALNLPEIKTICWTLLYRPLYIPSQTIQLDICFLEMKAAQVYFLIYLFIFGKC